jgi:DNA-binding PadR family transcriptional regulator
LARPTEAVSEEMKDAFSFSSFHSGFLKLAIMKMISERPMHGYALMKEIDRLSEHTWKPSPGSIYPALQELQRSGFITQETVGRKRVYHLTPDGTGVLGQAIEHVKVGVKSLQSLIDYKPKED